MMSERPSHWLRSRVSPIQVRGDHCTVTAHASEYRHVTFMQFKSQCVTTNALLRVLVGIKRL